MADNRFDLIVSGCTLIDGTGAPPRRADLAVRGDTIAAIGDLSGAEAGETLVCGVPDSTGGDNDRLCLAPGFIDAHSHSDTYLLLEPDALSKITQGITTEVVGNCGASAAPLMDPARLPSDWRDLPYPGTWATVAEFRKLLDDIRPAVNSVLLVGHNTLRAGVMGYENRPPRPDELRDMQSRLAQAMDEGAHGISSGLIYPPGIYAKQAELAALARTAAEHGGLYTTHMRSETGGLIDAIGEAIAIGRDGGAPVEIAHLKTGMRAVWNRIDEALGLIENAHAEGLDVTADRYPYTASCTGLDVVFPAWAEEGGNDAILTRLRDPALRERIRRELDERFGAEAWQAITIGSTEHPDQQAFRGRPLVEVADALNGSPAEAILQLVEKDELKTMAFFGGMSEDNMFRILAQPWVMIGSDASLRGIGGILGNDFPHPRAFGTFPRFLRLALDRQLLPLPEIVRKMTSLPAGRFGLRDRGVIREGAKADLVVFDPKTVCDAATFADPRQLAVGIPHVIVNGVLTISHGTLTGQRAGHCL